MSNTQDSQPAGPFLELNDPEVTAEALERAIAARLRNCPPAEIPDFPVYDLAPEPPAFPAGIPYRFGHYYHLQRANALYNQAETDPVLASSPATQLPLLGRLWQFIRAEAHQLVLFYVNRHIGQQTQVNRHLVQTLNELTRQVEEQQRTIQHLQAQLAGRTENEPPPLEE